jgi:hypothetical protein
MLLFEQNFPNFNKPVNVKASVLNCLCIISSLEVVTAPALMLLLDGHAIACTLWDIHTFIDPDMNFESGEIHHNDICVIYMIWKYITILLYLFCLFRV